MPSSLPSLSLLLLLLLLTTSSTFTTAASPPRACEMSTVASIPLLDFLDRLQETALAAFGPRNFDPKLYVDLSLKSDVEAIKRAFAGLPRSPNGSVLTGDLERFIAAHFEGAGADLVYALPADFVPEPKGFLPRVKDSVLRAWALEVHALWRNLSRRVDDAVRERPDRHTLLPLQGNLASPMKVSNKFLVKTSGMINSHDITSVKCCRPLFQEGMCRMNAAGKGVSS